MLPSPPSCVVSKRVVFLLQATRRGPLSHLVHIPITKPKDRFFSSRSLYGTHRCTRAAIMSQPVDIPKEQWAQVTEKDGVIKYKKIPVPTPGHDEVLVNIKYSGVCHTDLHALDNDWPLPRKTPVIGGHEGAGVVVQKGELVTNVDIGDKVGVKWLMSTCFHCTFCQQALESLCPKAQLSGYTKDGTFQQYCVANAAHLARFPPQTDLSAVAPIMCAGLTVYKGLKESDTRPGQYVAIVGAGGGLGTIGIQYAHAMGLNVIAIDSGKEKGEACKKLGAAMYIDFKDSKDLVADVKKATHDGLGPQGVILLAPQEQPFQQATDYVRSHGTVVCIGMPAGAKVSMPVFDTVVRMIKVKGSYVGNREDTAEALDFFLRGKVHAPYKVIGLSQLQNVFDEMRANKVIGRYVMDMSK